MTKSAVEESFNTQLISCPDMPQWERQFRFGAHVKRQFLADFCWPRYMIIVEIHGGTYTGKGHASGEGIQSDSEKLNLAMVLGYKMFTFTSRDVRTEWACCMMEGLLIHGCNPTDWKRPKTETEIKECVRQLRIRRNASAISRPRGQTGLSQTLLPRKEAP